MHNKWIQFTAYLVALEIWAGAVLLAPPSILKSAVTIGLLLTLPGYLIFKLLVDEYKAKSQLGLLAYAAALSSLFLMLVGLAMSVTLPHLGIQRPLEQLPLVLTITPILGALGGWVIKRRGGLVRLPKVKAWPRRAWMWGIVGTSLPILAAAGAMIQNNGGSNAITLGMFGLTAVYALGLVWPSQRPQTRAYAYGLFSMALALLLSTSLRGWNITGHDVMQEYQVFQITSQHGVWNINFLRDAYNACLSITILPTILAKLSGLSDPYVYKLVFQFMFALMPAALYLGLARFMRRKAAFLAAFLFISFPTFLTDMPMLNRQEMAFLYVTLMVMTMFDKHLGRAARSALVILLGIGMVLSHYSTSYVLLGLVVIAKMLELVLMRIDQWRKSKVGHDPVLRPLSWPVTLIFVLTVYLWNTQITNTSSHFATTLVSAAQDVPKLFQSGAMPAGAQTQQQEFSSYVDGVIKSRDFATDAYYPSTVTDKYPLVQTNEAVSAPTHLGSWLQTRGASLYKLYDFIRGIYAKLVLGLMVLGLGVLLIRYRSGRVPRQFLLLGAACLVMIAVQVLLPAAIDYGLLRLVQQSLIFLGPIMILFAFWLLSLIRIKERWAARLIALVLVGFYAVNSWLIPSLTGGYKASLTTANSGFYYEAYYTHDSEIAGYSWITGNVKKGTIINADQFARRKMTTYVGNYAIQSLAPDDISKSSYVYLSYGDTTFGQVPIYYNGNLIFQQTPTAFLDDNKNLVYSNGPVKIYH